MAVQAIGSRLARKDDDDTTAGAAPFWRVSRGRNFEFLNSVHLRNSGDGVVVVQRGVCRPIKKTLRY
jgi:hypothetical protein